jgi:hypothetical protein
MIDQPRCRDGTYVLENSKSGHSLDSFLPLYIFHLSLLSFLQPDNIKTIIPVCHPIQHLTVKMRASIITAIYPLLALCAAQPFDGKSSKFSNTTSPSCISPADAILIANGFGQILSNFSMSFGDTLIADDYVDQSDSVATLMHSPNLLASDVCSPFFFF